MIAFLAMLGLVRNLRRTDDLFIAEARRAADRERLRLKYNDTIVQMRGDL